MVSNQFVVKTTLAIVCVLGWVQCVSAMYDPSLGRFVSRDPIGYIEPERSLFSYVGNGPFRYVDPSGLKKCTCDEFVDAYTDLFGNPGSVQGPEKPPRTCKVSIFCDGNCPAPAHASPLKADGSIDICISTRGISDYDDMWKVLEHEWQHAKDFCVNKPITYPSPCRRCVVIEESAHKTSCKLSFAEGSDQYKLCVECGVWKSCRGACPRRARPKGCDDWGDLGTPNIDPVVWPFLNNVK